MKLEDQVISRLENELKKLIVSKSLDDRDIDPSRIDMHINALTHSTAYSQKAFYIYDVYKQEKIYESPVYQDIFNTGSNDYELLIHPEDLPQVMKNNITAFRHLFFNNKEAKNIRIEREFRMRCKGLFRDIHKTVEPLDLDAKKNVWLLLGVISEIEDQTYPSVFSAKFIYLPTGKAYVPVDRYYHNDRIFSAKEMEVVKYLKEGLDTTAIAEKMNLSVHTVNTHRQRIVEKLQVKPTDEIIKYAEILGII